MPSALLPLGNAPSVSVAFAFGKSPQQASVSAIGSKPQIEFLTFVFIDGPFLFFPGG
jgi:hypothetical protein